ncbi:UPF0182 protein [Desulfosarcina alkanivorans]|uniref:UPF0182 protein DSCA_31390 n=1 Tax=Desulfosarcina alkanivorans TaxID=571177 RepID=A0A5K7YMV7_9BACT|nr:UPF0182 family protein [Desulfosarcina alkanivorans]BBO69209.1 UPF0182 protein [Desulfosarcina alkanivorans]
MKTPWKKRILITAAALVAMGLVIILLNLFFVDFVVDFWWFQSQGMTVYLLMRLIYRYLVFAFFTAIFFGFFTVNFWFASRVIGVAETSRDKNDRNLVKTLHNGLRRMYLPLSVLMALPIAAPMYTHWEKALLFLFGGASGTADPLLGKDISFYLLSLPVYTLIQKEVLVAFIILLVGVMFLYWYESRLLAIEDQALPRIARVHVSALTLATVAIVCWGILFERYRLLYETVNLPIFFGPGYVEMKIILPMIWLSVIFLAATGISLVVSVNRKAGWKLPVVFVGLFALSVMGKNADFFNDLVRKYIVAPNQIARERPYIDANIRSTLAAYGLDAIQTQDFRTQSTPAFDADDPALVRRLQNIPVWDREMLGSVYEELQGIRTYYSFPTIDVDRYTVEDSYRQVYLGAREIQFSKLPESAQNWINLHLQYTHGQGVVMIPAAQAGDEFMTWLIKDIPPRSDFGLSVNRTSIYYGLEDKPYAIVPNDAGEIGSPVGDDEAIVHYDGNGGVPVNSLWRKLLFSMYFKDRNIFFTAKTNDRSRLLFRRNILDRITHMTPFLKLDQDPYIVSTADGLFWIQDAYTTADNYPLAPAVEGGFNYIRNAVKIVVDAYHGKVSYYVSDSTDPIINAYRRMYPGVFRPLAQMPPGLRKHVRYPRDIFLTQVGVYARYHQQDPERFYRQEDIWEFSKVPQGRDLVPANPYYLTLDLIEPGRDDFLLFMPMAPFGRDNLRALIIAGSDGDNYGKIFAYRFPRDQQVYGPAQVHSLVNQDIVISEQFTLWDQEGSEVLLGKMIIEPTGGSLLYIQPVYLQEEGALKIPQLKRLIMALDDAVVMAPSLEEAAVMLEAELARKSTRRTQPMPQPTPPDAAVKPPGGESSPPALPDAKVPGEPPAGDPKPGDTPRS